MKYPYITGFFAGAMSIFDIGGTLPEGFVNPLSKGLGFDMRQLSDDQTTLTSDYQKASDRIKQEFFGDHFE